VVVAATVRRRGEPAKYSFHGVSWLRGACLTVRQEQFDTGGAPTASEALKTAVAATNRLVTKCATHQPTKPPPGDSPESRKVASQSVEPGRRSTEDLEAILKQPCPVPL
jgi:hypothetical protein